VRDFLYIDAHKGVHIGVNFHLRWLAHVAAHVALLFLQDLKRACVGNDRAQGFSHMFSSQGKFLDGGKLGFSQTFREFIRFFTLHLNNQGHFCRGLSSQLESRIHERIVECSLGRGLADSFDERNHAFGISLEVKSGDDL
jgi:hypothetical protein